MKKTKPAFEIISLQKSDRGLLEAAILLAKATGKAVRMRTAGGCLVIDPKREAR